MSKVKSKIKLLKDPVRGWVLVPVDINNVKKQAIEKFVTSDAIKSIVLDMEIKAPHVEKTLSQLGFLHAAVFPVFYAYYTSQGQPAETPEQKEQIRDDVKHAIGFIEHRLNCVFDAGGHVRTSWGKSFADASKEETSEAIDSIIRLAADFGMVVPGPAEYLEKHGAKDFES